MIAPAAGPTILFLATEDWYFVSHRLELARAVRAAGYRVVVATRVRAHGEAITEAGLELVPIPWRRTGNRPWDHWRAASALVRAYREVRPDLAHHVALKPVVFGSYAARRAGVPRVVNAVAGLGFVYASPAVRALLLRIILSPLLRWAFASRWGLVIVQNPEDRAALLGRRLATGPRIRLIRGAGVDPDKFTGPTQDPDPPVVLFASRMLWDKGVGTFVAAATEARRIGLRARFVLVGEPDPDNPGAVPTAQLQAWDATGVVEWWGHRADMPEVMRQATIFCLPTRYGEGVPKVLLEAGAAGLGLIASDAPGCREVVRDGETGILVAGADPVRWVRAIGALLADPARRCALGIAARSLVVQEFSLDAVIRQTLELYRELLAS